MSDRQPQNIEAERATLGAMLLAEQANAANVIPDVAAMLQGRDYWQPAHEAIHDAITGLYDTGQAVDPVTVMAELQRRGELQRIGGAPYLHTLTAETPLVVRAAQYAAQVLDAAQRRRLLQAAQQITELAHDAEDAAMAAQSARQVVDTAAESANTAEAGVTVGSALPGAIDWLEHQPVGAETPWVDVNTITNGLLAGQMVTVAARPGHGKSLVAKDVALFTALQGRPAHVATLEMSRNEYMARILSGLGRVDLGRMLRREMNDTDWQAVAAASERVSDLPLYLDDRPGQSMAQIRAAARQTARRYGTTLGVIAIDYAQLVKPADARLPREQQVAQISRDTKLLAKEFECPVLLLAQLNRGNTQRSDHTPLVSDLRESGSLEQDSDQVWLLHRADQYPGGEERLGEVDLIVGKNRNGPAPTTISLAFQGHYGRITSLA